MESTLLNHYKISTLYPDTWPEEKDRDDSSEDEPLPSKKINPRRSKSRYSVLERNASARSSVPGAERSKDGVENLVQKDEPDPLGGQQSVIQVLRQRGVPVEDNQKLRNQFLLSSTTFSPAAFLSQVHSYDTTDDLLSGLDFLSRSIEKKSASLKVLVESNFERFVRAKATIDNVYTEMRSQGLDQEPTPQSLRRQGHSRNASKSSGHWRKTSGPFSPTLSVDLTPNNKRKNALIKETDYGVQPIKTPLLEIAVKAEEVWGPALGGREREDNLKAVLACVEKHRGVFEVAANINDAIKRRDHDTLVEEYVKAQRYANDAKSIVEASTKNRQPMSDADVHQVIVTARMWSDVEEQIQSFKRDVWRRLAGTHFTKTDAHVEAENQKEPYMELITVLLELGVEDNPISVWLFSRYDFLRNKITGTVERLKVEIEILRRRLAAGEKSTAKQLASHLRAAAADGRIATGETIDAPRVMEVWEHIYASMNTLLSSQGGLLGEVVEFWETAQSFIDGKAQRSLPAGINGDSRKHHRLSVDGVKDLSSGAVELLTLLRENVFSIFSDPPIEDLSLLLSPIPKSPDSPTAKSPSPGSLSPFADSRFRYDAANFPPPSPRTGEFWEKYAFWPPYANSLSGAYYLSKMLTLAGTAASNMASLSILRRDPRSSEQLKALVGGLRERCVQAVCAAWNTDAENCKVLEDWKRAPERHDLTNMPQNFMKFEGLLLANLQKILYVSEAKRRADIPDVIVPPSSKLLQIVRVQFVSSLYKALSGMVENAEKGTNAQGAENDVDDMSASFEDMMVAGGVTDTIHSSKKSTRILMTLSNIQSLRNEIVPHLITQFETSFTVKLTDETKQIRDVLSKIDTQLFQSYVAPPTSKLDNIVRDGVASSEWAPIVPRPTNAQAYVYSALLTLVLVHTEVSTTAAPLTAPILKYLLEQLSSSLLEAFKQRQQYSLPALMQATLDVEFLAQTLNNYTTDRASETQSAIYVALDERTDNEARLKLQEELQEMRAILKRLREATRVELCVFTTTSKPPRANLVIVPVSRGQGEAPGRLVERIDLLQGLDLELPEPLVDSCPLRLRRKSYLEVICISCIPTARMYGDDVISYAFDIYLRALKSNKRVLNLVSLIPQFESTPSSLDKMAIDLAPLSSLNVSKHLIPGHNLVPNTSIQNKPLLIYHSCFPSTSSPSQIETHLRSVGVVTPQWRYTMYSTSHFHSTTHEVLVIASGAAKICLGGEDNPGRVEPTVRKGDVIIMPAGVGHRLLEEVESPFLMVGSYPPGKEWDMCYGKAGEETKVKGIATLGWFERDPVYGEKGPALDV